MARYAELFRAAAGAAPAEKTPAEEPQPGDPSAFTLLFVDDEEGVLRAMRRIFLDENYQVLTARDAREALQIMESRPVQLVVSDHRMPGMSGAQLLKEIKERWPETIRIMLTGHADVHSIMGAVNEGAVFKFITKPWHDEDLRLTVSLALQQYVLLKENRRLKEINRRQQAKIKNYAGLIAKDNSILETVLIRAGAIDADAFRRAAAEAQKDEFITDALVRLGIVSETKLIRTLQNELHLEYVDLKEVAIAPEVVRFLPADLCRRSRILPIRLQGRRLTLAMADPTDMYKCDNIALMTGCKVLPVIARSADILAQIDALHADQGAASATDAFDDLPELEPMDEVDIVIEEEETLNLQELISSSEVPPIIRIVNAVISEAVRFRASDIHIEPKTKFTVVRFRIDGILHDKIRIPADLHPAVISRIKILAKLDISERRIPQDGRITVKSGVRLVDLRVSTMPSINGEKVVLRVLDKSAAVKRLDELGLLGDDLVKIRRLVKKPQGMFISTGPTGSGKTTMLYSVLGEMLERSRNFETIEDPVEYFVEEANQVFVRERVGLSFASVLRATLRQDPDVILVGEIRDLETADVAFKAALTGHMVLTSLHTNSSVASITRLIDIGIKPYLIASALEGITAQRLVRRLCSHCRTEGEPRAEALSLLRLDPTQIGPVHHARGCGRCGESGYAGRIGLFELFVMNDDFRHLISERYKESELLDLARAGGMRTLIEDGAAKVRQGETTLEELLRVIGPQIRHERTCTGCARTVDAKFLFCPHCGELKKSACTNCRMTLEDGWVVCAFCGHRRP